MSDEIAQKVGRGGAGNFYTKADVETVLDKTLPPQTSSGSSPPADKQSQSPTYVRTGRGGMGNLLVPSDELPTSSSDGKSDVQSAREALNATREKPKDKISSNKNTAYRGHSGRGGVGNLRMGIDEAERRKRTDDEMKARGKLDESIRLHVETELKPPPKVHAAPENAF